MHGTAVKTSRLGYKNQLVSTVQGSNCCLILRST